MKSFLVAAALATTAVVAAEKCELSQLIPIFLPIVGEDCYKLCQSETGYTFYPFTGLPTPEQEAAMCKNKNCQDLLTLVIAADPPACDVEYQGQTYNLKAMVDKYASCIGTR